MPSPKLSLRVADETLAQLQELADREQKTMTELLRELIELGLLQKTGSAAPPHIQDDPVAALAENYSDRIDLLETHLGELLTKSVRAGAEASFYSKLAMTFSSEVGAFLIQGKPLDKETKQQYLKDMEKMASDLSLKYLHSHD